MTVYDSTFFTAIRPGVQRSAKVVVSHLVDWWYRVDDSMSVLDVGCGEGHWAEEFADRTGCRVLGVDSGQGAGSVLGPNEYCELDLAATLAAGEPLPGGFDLAVCLEVAEHLPPELSDVLVRELCRAAPVVLFSAAVPGQPGLEHVNCQWQTVWAERFEEAGFYVSQGIAWDLWEDSRVEWWYCQDMFLAWQPGVLPHDRTKVHAVIHPEHWQVR